MIEKNKFKHIRKAVVLPFKQAHSTQLKSYITLELYSAHRTSGRQFSDKTRYILRVVLYHAAQSVYIVKKILIFCLSL